jgi:hypothetical protein
MGTWPVYADNNEDHGLPRRRWVVNNEGNDERVEDDKDRGRVKGGVWMGGLGDLPTMTMGGTAVLYRQAWRRAGRIGMEGHDAGQV